MATDRGGTDRSKEVVCVCRFDVEVAGAAVLFGLALIAHEMGDLWGQSCVSPKK